MKSISALALALCFCTPIFAQDDNPFLLKRGDNEFGFWAGFSRRAVNIGVKFHHISNGD